MFKIVLSENDEYKTLFHGTRVLEKGKWLKANKRLVRDGTGGRLYLSGFHVFREEKIAKEYLKKFRTDKTRVIIKVKARGLRQKPTNDSVFLADEIKLPAQ